LNIESLGFESINPNQEFSKQSKYLERERSRCREERENETLVASDEVYGGKSRMEICEVGHRA